MTDFAQGQDFTDKVVIVTGGASGIGAAAVRGFLGAGAKVAAVDITDEALEAIADAVDDRNRLQTLACDVSDPEQVNKTVAEVIDRFGGLDVLVNNAGVGSIGKVEDVDDAEWRKTMAINVDGVFHFARAALPHLKRRGGNIVNTASISGLRGDKSMVAYDTSKGAVVNFTRATAVDYGKEGVRVNSVCPGPVRTPILNEALAIEEISEQYEERIPLARVGEPEDIAMAIGFLASSAASLITGANLPIDGGLTAWSAQPNIAQGLST